MTCQTLENLEPLAESWDLLAATSGSPMGSYAWARAWADTFAAEYDLHVVALRGQSELSAIAPLAKRKRRGTYLELLSVNELDEPMDFLYATPSTLRCLADALAQLSFPVLLERIPAESPVVGALQRSYRRRGVVICRPAAGCPWIPLDASWKQPEQHLNPRRRSDLQRNRRVAGRMGPLSFEVVSPTPTNLGLLLEEAFRVEASGWKGRTGTALARDAARRFFFSRYAEAACQKGILRLCFLHIGGRAAAMQLGVECDDRFWQLKIGYDQAFAHCSPGNLLMLEMTRYAAERSLRSYEFLGGEPWTQMWTSLVRPCISLRAYPASFRGMTALAGDISKFGWRRLDQVVQGRWRKEVLPHR